MRVVLNQKNVGEIQLRLARSGREVALRLGTTDMQCFEEVFLDQEYKPPFPIKPKVIVDAGANIGMTTLYYAQIYPDARIIAIEPEPSNFEMLVKNCGNLANVTLVKGAIWCEDRQLKFENPMAEKWAFSVVESRESSPSDLQDVMALTVPGIMNRIGADRIDILKLDIEGSEVELFRSGADAWLGTIRQIVIELHDRLRPGCAQSFYSAIGRRVYSQESRGQTIFINFENQRAV